MMVSEIAEYFSDRSVFITGASGFLGKAMLEKLLRSCPLLKQVFILMRPKSGLNVEKRLLKLLEDPVFNTLRWSNPRVFEKVVPIAGDISLPEIVLNKKDREFLIDTVSVVIHSAALVKFNADVSVMIEHNVRGVQRVIELCKKFKFLQALVHVSSAYSQADRNEIDEIIYPLQQCEKTDKNSSELIFGKPNKYIFTKALAELILMEEAKNLPICIVRPSIITGAWKEPIPGWVDGMNGPVASIASWARGVMRSFLCYKRYIVDFIPVDICANLVIAAAYQKAKEGNGMSVFNCCSGHLNPLTWGTVEANINKIVRINPSSQTFRSPRMRFTSSLAIHRVHRFYSEFLPAFGLDSIRWIQGKQPRGMRLYRKLEEISTLMGFVTTNEWKFLTSNMETLFNGLSEEDKEIFNFNVKAINWTNYLGNYWMGIREYILKEPTPIHIQNILTTFLPVVLT